MASAYESHKDYLLGDFDARRMIRLEGLPLARGQARIFEMLQRRYPLLERNITYVTNGFGEPGQSASFRTHWRSKGTFSDGSIRELDDQSLWRAPSAFLMSSETWSSQESLAQTREIDPTWLVGGKNFAHLSSTHECGHGAHAELALSDECLDTSLIEDLDELLVAHIATYYGRFEPWDEDVMSDELSRMGISCYAGRDVDELVGELTAKLRLDELTGAGSIPLICDFVAFLDKHMGADSPTRHERQAELLEYYPSKLVLGWDRPYPSWSADEDHQYLGVLEQLSFDRVFAGTEHARRVVSWAEGGHPQRESTLLAALEVSRATDDAAMVRAETVDETRSKQTRRPPALHRGGSARPDKPGGALQRSYPGFGA